MCLHIIEICHNFYSPLCGTSSLVMVLTILRCLKTFKSRRSLKKSTDFLRKNPSGVLPSKFLNRSESALQNSRALFLFFAVFPLVILNFITSWCVQHQLLPAFTLPCNFSWFESVSCSRASPFTRTNALHRPPGLLCLCADPAEIKVKVPHEYQGIWMWGFFHLYEEGNISFLTRELVTDAPTAPFLPPPTPRSYRVLAPAPREVTFSPGEPHPLWGTLKTQF